MNIFADDTVKIVDNTITNISTLGFAQKTKAKKKLKYKRAVGFSRAPGNKQSSPLAENSENLELLNKISEANTDLSKAIVVHNKVRS